MRSPLGPATSRQGKPKHIRADQTTCTIRIFQVLAASVSGLRRRPTLSGRQPKTGCVEIATMRALLPAGWDGSADPAHPAHSAATAGDGDRPVDLHAYYAHDWVAEGGVRVNFVSSVDGAGAASGLSRGLQTPGDNAVFAVLRDMADVILVGAATAAAERYRPANPSARRRAVRSEYGLAEVPAIAVMSSSLQLDLAAELFSAATQAPTLVITGSAAPISARNDIIDLAGGQTRPQPGAGAAQPGRGGG